MQLCRIAAPAPGKIAGPKDREEVDIEPPNSTAADRASLARAVAQALETNQAVALTALNTDSVSHSHFRVAGQHLIVRVPRFSHWDKNIAEQLAYEAEAFRRAAPSGHTPELHAVVPVNDDAPAGALIVEEIDGGFPALSAAEAPTQMAAIADALVALHSLPVPPARARAPLQVHEDPTAETLAAIKSQAVHLEAAGLSEPTRSALTEELAWADAFADEVRSEPAPTCLVGTDTHPGNFLIDATGRAWFVDLEKLVYGHPAIDLAHATLAASVGWDRRNEAPLTPDVVTGFYRHYLDCMDAQEAARLIPWLAPMRRLTWLRTMTWFVRWRADWSRDAKSAIADATLRRHIETHIAACFEPDAITAARAEWLRGPSPVPQD